MIQNDGITFTPHDPNAPAPISGGDFGFKADGGTATIPAKQGGSFLGDLGNAAGAVGGFINNNPISKGLTSLSALPVQLLAKAIGQPDPYAGGIGTGPAAAHVTSSDQPLGKFAEEEAGNALTVGSLFLPAGRIAEAGAPYLAPALGRFAPSVARIGTQTGIGAFQGLASGMQQGQNLGQLGSSAQTGALLGGGLATAGELGGALVDNFASNSGTTRLEAQKNNLKTLQNAYNNTSSATTNPIKTLEQNNLIGDLRVIDGKVNIEGLTNVNGTGSIDNMIHEQQAMGTQAVSQMKGGISTDTLKQTVVDAIKNSPTLKASGQVGKMVAEVGRRFDDYAESYGETIPYADVNSIRVAMNRVWDPESWDAEKAIGNAARSVLYNGSGAGTTLKSAMANEQELINAKEFVQKLGGTAVRGGRLGKYIADLGAGVAGSVAGAPFGPLGSGIGAAASGVAADKIMGAYQRNYFSPMLSGPAQKLQSLISAPASEAGRRLIKSLLITGSVQK